MPFRSLLSVLARRGTFRPVWPLAMLVALGLGSVAGCDAAEPLRPLPPTPEAIASRPGGLGSLDSVRYVVHLSIDGLRPDAVELLGSAGAPAFARLRQEGASTHNARTDVTYRHTLPNHATQLTGRPVGGAGGHGWTDNGAPAATLHANRGAYVASAFDVAHDHGLRTAAYASKLKFWLFDQSYDAAHGAPDLTGADDGTDKIDVYVHHPHTDDLAAIVTRDLRSRPSHYTFVHFDDPDTAGHESSWSVQPGSAYLRAVQAADRGLGALLAAIEADPQLRGRTALVVTADHGGSGTGHYSDRPEDYTVPFYVWGPGIRPADLYALNAHRRDPGDRQPTTVTSPIRNGDAANLALALLGLGPVPGSTLGADVPLRVSR